VPERGPALGAVAGLADAVSFLTRLRLPGRAASHAVDLPRASVFFPLVGAAIGALVGGVTEALDEELTALLAATVAVAAEVALTGALHLDGLADTADGLAGADRERRLEIMRDHALGTYGGAALALVLLAKIAALAALAETGVLGPAVAAYALSRAAPLPLAAALPYARAGAGTGRTLTEGLTRVRALIAVGVATAIAVAFDGLPGLVGLAALVLVGAALGSYARRRLGGVTGDVMGAAIELTATLALVSAVAPA
jgi:adenosylcobinamide-GDP ribazoletransferase